MRSATVIRTARRERLLIVVLVVGFTIALVVATPLAQGSDRAPIPHP